MFGDCKEVKPLFLGVLGELASLRVIHDEKKPQNGWSKTVFRSFRRVGRVASPYALGLLSLTLRVPKVFQLRFLTKWWVFLQKRVRTGFLVVHETQRSSVFVMVVSQGGSPNQLWTFLKPCRVVTFSLLTRR